MRSWIITVDRKLSWLIQKSTIFIRFLKSFSAMCSLDSLSAPLDVSVLIFLIWEHIISRDYLNKSSNMSLSALFSWTKELQKRSRKNRDYVSASVPSCYALFLIFGINLETICYMSEATLSAPGYFISTIASITLLISN